MFYLDMETIKQLNKDKGFFFFSPDTMRFFKSRTGTTAYRIGNKAYFVTSEQRSTIIENIQLGIAILILVIFIL
jgi:hypothetical protein